MEEEFDPYRILGLPLGSDEAAVQQRYRELVRKHHPDVSSDTEKAHQRFVRIQQAYRMLMDPQERARRERRMGLDTTSAAGITIEGPRSRFDELLLEGRRLLRQRKLRQARDVVAGAIELNPFSADAYRLLGDIYMAGGNTQMCLDLYQEAELLDARPQVHRTKPSDPVRPAGPPIAPPAPIRGIPVIAGVAATVGALVLMQLTGFAEYPWRFAACGCGAAFLLALTGAGSGLIEPFDELLGLAEVTEPRRAAAPGGLYVIVTSVISPVAGLAVYVVVSLLAETFSKGILKVYLVTFGVAFLAWQASEHAGAVLLYGPSLAFVAALIGWLAGSFATPSEWWRRQ